MKAHDVQIWEAGLLGVALRTYFKNHQSSQTLSFIVYNLLRLINIFVSPQGHQLKWPLTVGIATPVPKNHSDFPHHMSRDMSGIKEVSHVTCMGLS